MWQFSPGTRILGPVAFLCLSSKLSQLEGIFHCQLMQTGTAEWSVHIHKIPKGFSSSDPVPESDEKTERDREMGAQSEAAT